MNALAGTAILLLAGLTLFLARAIAHSHERTPRLVRRPLDASERPPEPTELTALGRLLHDANEHAGAVELRLRPLVRDIAKARLRERGIDPDRATAAVEDGLGEPLAQLLRKDDARSTDRRAPGLSRDELHRLIEELEAL